MAEPSRLEMRYLQAVANHSSAGLRRRRRAILGIAIAVALLGAGLLSYAIAAEGLPLDGSRAGFAYPLLATLVLLLVMYERVTFHQGAVEHHERQRRP